MKLVDLLSKVHMGGLIEVCAVSKTGRVLVADDTSSIFVHIKPTVGSFDGLPCDMGFRDLGVFIRVLSNMSGSDSIKFKKNEITVIDRGGRINLKLSDLRAIPEIEDPIGIMKDLKRSLVVKATVAGTSLEKLAKKVSQLRPEIITVEAHKLSLICKLGDPIGHTGHVVIARGQFGDKHSKSVYRSSHIEAVLKVVSADKVYMAFGDDLPLMIKEKTKEMTSVWFLSPFSVV